MKLETYIEVVSKLRDQQAFGSPERQALDVMLKAAGHVSEVAADPSLASLLGKLNGVGRPDAVGLALSIDKQQRLRLDFGAPVEFFAFTADQADTFIAMLTAKRKELRAFNRLDPAEELERAVKMDCKGCLAGQLLLERLENPAGECTCRTSSCGHRASLHGPGGVCTVCKKACWM